MMLYKYYLIIKAIHIISVICFMAGMLYLPRLFVYHSKVAIDSESYAMFLIMEAKLLKNIMLPASITVFATGLYLFFMINGFKSGQMLLHFKLVLAIFMFAMHAFFSRCHKKFLLNHNKHGEMFFRIINEIPALLMVAMVIAVIFK